MTNQIKMTLQDAAERCNRDGGRIKIRNHWYIVDGSGFVVQENIKDSGYELRVGDFNNVIYEPPQQSAFQEWEESTSLMGDAKPNQRKAGWNGLIEVCEKIAKEGNKDYVSLSTIRELKEP